MRYKLGGFLLIAGIVFTFFDGIYYLMIKKEYNFTMVGEVWYYIHPYSLQIIQPIVERYIMVFLWDPLLLTLLQLPFGLFILFLGFLLLLNNILKCLYEDRSLYDLSCQKTPWLDLFLENIIRACCRPHLVPKPPLSPQ